MPLRSTPRRFIFHTWCIVGAIALAGALVTWAVFAFLVHTDEEAAKSEIRRAAETAVPRISNAIASHSSALRTFKDLFALNRFMAWERFQPLAQDALNRNAGLTSIHWAPALRNQDRALFEQKALVIGPPGLRIENSVTTGNAARGETYPLFYSLSSRDAKPALGQDLNNTDLAPALARARETLQPVITELRNEPSARASERSVTLVLPVVAMDPDEAQNVKRGDFIGFVLGTLDLAQALKQAELATDDSTAEWMLLDATPGTAERHRILFSSANAPADEDSFRQNWYREMPLLLGGRLWILRTRANPQWIAANLGQRNYVWIIGLLATAILTVYVRIGFAKGRTLEIETAKFRTELASLRTTSEDEFRRREAAESLLRSSQQQLHALMENSPSAIFIKDTDGRYLTVNRRFAEIYGKTRDHFVGRSDHELFPPEVASRMRLSDSRVLSSGKPIELEDSLMLPNGNHTSIVHKFPLIDEEGSVHGLCGIATDISERKRAEAEVRESRRQLESLLGQLPGMAFRFINDGQFTPVYVSRGALGLTGHSARDFIEGVIRLEDVIHPDDRERSKASIAAAVKKRRSFEVEYRIIDRTGRVKWVLERGQGVYDEEGKLLFVEGLAIDITQRKDAEAEKLLVERRLLEGQKLESIGVLAGGIAHDFNNLLTGIIGNANLAAVELPSSSRVQQNLRQIEIASQRAAELCQQMLAYAGKGRFMVQRVELGSLVENTVPLLRASISKRAQLQFDLAAGLPQVLADPTQMRQIVMNLVLNASEAIGEQDGEIVITTRLARPTSDDFASGAVLVPPELGQDYVLFQVRDTGCGMPPETIAKIFDPFFTTKFAGRGLGLAAVQGIIRSHKGGLRVMSSPGKGSTFTLLFPVATGPVEPGPARRNTAVPWRREGMALIIDDEDHVRNVTAGMLNNCGLRTEMARDGYEGLDLFRAKPQNFDIVLLDMTMPRLSGEETLQLLREVSPDVRVLFMSGYNRKEVVDALAGSGVLSFIQKPFTLEALRDQLQLMLA